MSGGLVTAAVVLGVLSAPSTTLTEDEAVRLAVERSRQLRSLETDVTVAVHRERSAGWVDNPELRIDDIGVSRPNDAFRLREEVEVGLRWRLPKLGELAEQEQRAVVRMWEARVRAVKARRRLAARVRRAYTEVVHQEALAALAERRVRIEMDRVALVERMKDLGQRSIVYSTKSRMWVAAAKTDQQRIARRLGAARRRLARLTGADPRVGVVAGDLPPLMVPAEDLVVRARAAGPEQRLMGERAELASRRYDRERLQLVPWPSFVQLSAHMEADRADRGELMVGVDLPLFDWNGGDIDATRLAHDRRSALAEALGERLRDDIADALAAYQEAREDWRLTRADSEALVGRVRAVIDEARTHGTVPADEVLELERTIVQAEELAVGRRHRAVLAGIDLCSTVGVPSLQHLVATAQPPPDAAETDHGTGR